MQLANTPVVSLNKPQNAFVFHRVAISPTHSGVIDSESSLAEHLNKNSLWMYIAYMNALTL